MGPSRRRPTRMRHLQSHPFVKRPPTLVNFPIELCALEHNLCPTYVHNKCCRLLVMKSPDSVQGFGCSLSPISCIQYFILRQFPELCYIVQRLSFQGGKAMSLFLTLSCAVTCTLGCLVCDSRLLSHRHQNVLAMHLVPRAAIY